MRSTTAHQDWTLAWWDWWFTLNWWQVLLVALAITPVGLWVVRRVLQGFWVNPLTHDWMSFNFDVFLACGMGVMFWLASTAPPGSGYTDGWVYALLNYGLIVFWLSFAIFKWWDERNDVRTWKRRLGATTLYHIGVLVYIGGLYSILFVNTVTLSWTKSWMYAAMHMVSVLAVGAWLFAGMVLDAKWRTTPSGESKFVYTSPEDGWRTVRLLWQWLTRNTGLAGELGTLRPWDFIINRRPAQGLLVLAMVSPGAFLALNWVMRSEWIPFSYQWYSALAGDMLLALLGWWCLFLLKLHSDRPPIDRPLFKRRVWHYVIVLGWYGVAVLHMWQESGSVTTWERRLGANAVYHNFVVYPLLGYGLTVLVIAAFKYMRWLAWVGNVAAIFLFVGGWLLLGMYDGSHQFAPNGVSKHVYSSPEDGWRNVRLLFEWIASLVG